MENRIWKILCICAVTLSLGACQMLPVEETLPPVPVVRNYKVSNYTYSEVMRGNLADIITIRCTYNLAKEESLGFSTGGLLIDFVPVTEGQHVKAGDLLVSLEQHSLQQQLESQQHQLNLLFIRQRHLKQSLQLDLDGYNALYAQLEQERGALLTASPDQTTLIQKLDTQMQTLQQYIAQAQNRYDSDSAELEQSIYVQNLKVTELESKLAQQQLYAGIDGVVTYLLPVTEGQRSVKGKSFVTISDLDSAAFITDSKNAEYLPVGTEVVINCQNTEYRAVVTDPAELNLEEIDSEKIYLKLLQPDPSLKKSTTGTISIILEEKENVLYVSADAVGTIDGKPFVYIPDENGLRTIQYVTTGLQLEDVIEITSGLKEGDRVIVESAKEKLR